MNKILEEDEFNEEELFSPNDPPKVTSNPLSGYFRLPGLSVQLPTKGRFLPKAAFNPSLNGEVAVYPMKAADEMLLRSPDALMNGDAIENLLLSCVPAITTPRLISTPDLDVLLLAIRAATYGEVMELEINCPSCNAENLFSCNLPDIIGNMTFLDENIEVRLTDEIVAKIRPYNLITATKVSSEGFNLARKLQIAQDSEDDDAIQRTRNEIYASMSDLNIESLSTSVLSITIPNQTVTDPKFILEFMRNTNQAWVKKIEKKLEYLNTVGIDRKFTAKCTKCNHEWAAEIEFDPASFFDLGS